MHVYGMECFALSPKYSGTWNSTALWDKILILYHSVKFFLVQYMFTSAPYLAMSFMMISESKILFPSHFHEDSLYFPAVLSLSMWEVEEHLSGKKRDLGTLAVHLWNFIKMSYQ